MVDEKPGEETKPTKPEDVTLKASLADMAEYRKRKQRKALEQPSVMRDLPQWMSFALAGVALVGFILGLSSTSERR